jgi:hypothetical protein
MMFKSWQKNARFHQFFEGLEIRLMERLRVDLEMLRIDLAFDFEKLHKLIMAELEVIKKSLPESSMHVDSCRDALNTTNPFIGALTKSYQH